jgi:hypothetical protein
VSRAFFIDFSGVFCHICLSFDYLEFSNDCLYCFPVFSVRRLCRVRLPVQYRRDAICRKAGAMSNQICIMEDCDQDAVYCVGHTDEFTADALRPERRRIVELSTTLAMQTKELDELREFKRKYDLLINALVTVASAP